jgi:hypothetical protein
MATLDAATLLEVKQRFLAHRTTAANRESWEQYAGDMLPLDKEPSPLIAQGFENGYAAAINRVAYMLDELRDEYLAQRGNYRGQWDDPSQHDVPRTEHE